MKFRNVISGPIFCADAPDVVIETADAAGIDVRLSISGFVWQFALSPVAEQSGYVATIKTRDILEALIEPSSIGSGGVSGVPVVEISAGADTESSISMSFLALYGSAAGKTPADMARHWLTWRDQISATYFGCRERLTFLAGLDLLGWKSGSYTVAVKIYTPSGIVQATLASGTIPSQVSYISVDASPASVLAVGEVSNILAYDLSFSLSGTAADDTAATVESYPLRLVLGAADPRAKEFIYINSLGVEDRVTACGIRKDGLEGGSSKFVNGGVEREHGNEAQEQFEVYSGHLATARSVEQWMEFLKSSERYLSSGGLKGIVIDDYNTEVQEGELCSVSFTYRLSERIKGFHHDDSESIGEYDPTQKYGALVVGDVPDAVNPPAEDLFFLKTRLDEFPLVNLSEDYLLLVQSPVSYHWGAASLDSVKNWIQKTIDHNGISLAAVWASLSKTVPDTYANELISEDHIPALPQSKVDGLAESLSALKTLIGGKADSSQLADYVLKSTYDTGMSGKLDKSVFDKLFTVHYKEGSATEIESLELNYGTWTTGFLSVRGLDDTTGSGSGGTDLPAVWASLTKNVLPYQDVTINTAHIPVLPQSKVTGLPDALSSLRLGYTGISALIPQAATADNQLADKEFVNSSIATATATFRGTFATLEALKATPADRNDYAFWAHKDADGNTCYDKYTYDGSAWKFEYRLNNSSFTAAQWGAINSGITDTLVTKLSGIATGAQVNVIETVKLGGTALAVSGKAVDITRTGIKNALGISDWALAASKPSYTTAEVTENTNLYFTDTRAQSALTGHTGDTTIHITAAERTAWNNKWDWNAADVKAVKVNAAGSADKLASSRKLWGNAFNGTADVSGDITLGSGKRIYFGSTSYYIELVNGNIHTNVGLYSDKFISARSADPNAGGGSGASLPVVWASLQGNTDDYKNETIHQAHIPTLPVSRIDGLATALAGKQPLITADSKLDYSLLKNTPTIGNGIITIKQGTNSQTFSTNQGDNKTITLTDTTYESKAAASGGTAVSLVTTGEKYTWNNKQAAISDLATIRSNAATAFGWGDHSKAGYITGITKAMVESVLTGNITSHTHTFDSLTSKPTTLAGYGITDASRIFRYTIPASGNKGVRITFSANEPVKITVSGSNQHAQLVLVGTGYGEGGFSRNNFTEVVPSPDGYSWCLSDDACSVEVFSARTQSDYVTVESPSPVTFTAISALSTDAAYRHLLTSANYSSYALPLTGGTMDKDAAISWGVNDRTDWDTYVSGIRVMSSITDNSGAPNRYATGISVMARYSFQIAARGGDVDDFFIRAGNRNWKKLLHEGNYSSYALPLTGGTMSGSIRMDGRTVITPLIRNYSSTVAGGWTRAIVECRVDDKNAFSISPFGNYTPGAANNKIDYVSLGFAGYNGLNLRISETDIKWGDSAIYHAGNFIDGTNYISPKTTLGGYGIEDWILEYTADSPDTFKTAGIYRVSTVGTSGDGYDFNYGQVLVLRGTTTSDTIAQIAVPYSSGNLYFRSGTLSNFTDAAHPWYTIYTSGNSNLPTVPWNCSSLVANGSITAGSQVNAVSIELGKATGTFNHGGYIDFHFNGSTEDYTSRIIESASGKLHLVASLVRIGNGPSVTFAMSGTSYDYIWTEYPGAALILGTADGGGTNSSNSAIFIKGKKVYIGGTETGNNALNVLGVAHATTGIYTDGYISARKQDTSSDIRLKTDFRPIAGALEYIRGTHFTRFRWKDGGEESVGIIAQEERNREYGFLVRSHGEIGYLTYDYAASTALLGAALQEEDEKVEALKKRVKELENELNKLKQSNYANR